METFWIPKFKFSFLNTRKLNFNNYVKTCLEIFSFPLNILCINNWNETNNGTIILFCNIVFRRVTSIEKRWIIIATIATISLSLLRSIRNIHKWRHTIRVFKGEKGWGSVLVTQVRELFKCGKAMVPCVQLSISCIMGFR